MSWYDADARPVCWPAPAGVLGFWESGVTAEEPARVTVVALVDAPDADAAQAIIAAGWPDVGKDRFGWRFVEEREVGFVPGDRFRRPKWAEEEGRPW